MSFTKILVANRDDSGCAAAVAAKPERVARAARATRANEIAAVGTLDV